MKAADLKKKNAVELKKMVVEMETEIREFRFGMSGGRTKNVRKARSLRKDIARIKTILRAASHA